MYNYYYVFALLLLFASCEPNDQQHADDDNGNKEITQDEETQDMVFFSEQQFSSLGVKIDTIPMRNITSYVEANGQLEVPPQNEAAVTAMVGANVTSIKVIEGDKVKQGQALAYLSHPDLVVLQTEFLEEWNQLPYLEKEYERQKTLYEAQVGAGREFQKIESDLRSLRSRTKGLEVQLKLLGIDISALQNDTFFERIPVRSPIDGYIRKVKVKTGQYVEAQTVLFDIVNIDHIHADLMVFEKDMHKVSKGQKIRFTLESLPDKALEATIFAVGKSFEQDPKALHIHAEIENKEGLLIPGMYVRGKILVGEENTLALPEEGIVRDGGKHYIFRTEKQDAEMGYDWAFRPVEVIPGVKSDGWVEIKLLNALADSVQVAWNNAYYLLAEMTKEEAGHHH
jgi:cobalt-zinc-cadmium efflux system membrane fusion protein